MNNDSFIKSSDETSQFKHELPIHHTCYQDVLSVFAYFQRELFLESKELQEKSNINQYFDWSSKEVNALVDGLKQYGTSQNSLKKILKYNSDQLSPSHRTVPELKKKMNELKNLPQYKKIFQSESDKPDLF